MSDRNSLIYPALHPTMMRRQLKSDDGFMNSNNKLSTLLYMPENKDDVAKTNTNFRIGIMTKNLQEIEAEITLRKSLKKKYKKVLTAMTSLEAGVLITELTLGILSAIPIVGIPALVFTLSTTSMSVFSILYIWGNQVISKKKHKHDKIAAVAEEAYNTHSVSYDRIVNDGEVTHEEFVEFSKMHNVYKKAIEDLKTHHDSEASKDLLSKEAREALIKEGIAKGKEIAVANIKND